MDARCAGAGGRGPRGAECGKEARNKKRVGKRYVEREDGEIAVWDGMGWNGMCA